MAGVTRRKIAPRRLLYPTVRHAFRNKGGGFGAKQLFAAPVVLNHTIVRLQRSGLLPPCPTPAARWLNFYWMQVHRVIQTQSQI